MRPPVLHVVAVNRLMSLALLSDDEMVPVTAWWDADGDDTDPDMAHACAVGPDCYGRFYSVRLDAFEQYTCH